MRKFDPQKITNDLEYSSLSLKFSEESTPYQQFINCRFCDLLLTTTLRIDLQVEKNINIQQTRDYNRYT